MTIKKGSPYGEPASAPAGAVEAGSDGEASAVLEAARRGGRPFPALVLTGGDLHRTLGGGGGVGFPVDLGELLVDGRLHLFVAHVVAHTPSWSYAFAAMNAQWLGRWNAGPRAHPGDGRLDVYEARLGLADRLKVRARLHHGAHLPHPGITERRVAAAQVDLPRPLTVVVDGRDLGKGTHISMRIEPDALLVWNA